MSNIISTEFLEFTRMIFNTGYSFLVGIHYPGLLISPLVLILTGSAIVGSIKLIKHILVEV